MVLPLRFVLMESCSYCSYFKDCCINLLAGIRKCAMMWGRKRVHELIMWPWRAAENQSRTEQNTGTRHTFKVHSKHDIISQKSETQRGINEQTNQELKQNSWTQSCNMLMTKQEVETGLKQKRKQTMLLPWESHRKWEPETGCADITADFRNLLKGIGSWYEIMDDAVYTQVWQKCSCKCRFKYRFITDTSSFL